MAEFDESAREDADDAIAELFAIGDDEQAILFDVVEGSAIDGRLACAFGDDADELDVEGSGGASVLVVRWRGGRRWSGRIPEVDGEGVRIE